MINKIILIVAGATVLFGCKRASEGSAKAGAHIKHMVLATVETTPVPQSASEDSADDPAVWIHPVSPGKSVIIGTDKKGGLATYSLNGKQLHYYPDGNMNNCDIRYGFPLNSDTVDVLAASNRSTHSLSLYKISEEGMLMPVHDGIIKSAMQGEVYGLCMYKSKINEKMYVFMNSKEGEIEQYELFPKNGKINARMVWKSHLNTQTEGMVTDDEKQLLYVGMEKAGIIKFNAEPFARKEGILLANSSEKNTNIKYDIEGLAIYDTGHGNGYLVASSQGNYSFAVFERQGENKYLGSFRIADGIIDGAEETDGIEISTLSVPRYEKGFMVVQDGYNYDRGKLLSQNFKIIPWHAIEKVIEQF